MKVDCTSLVVRGRLFRASGPKARRAGRRLRVEPLEDRNLLALGGFDILGPSGPIADSTPEITWQPSTEAERYDLLISDLPDLSSTVQELQDVPGTSVTLSVPLADGNYYIGVTAEGANPDPVVEAGPDGSIAEGGTFTGSGSFVDPPRETLDATNNGLAFTVDTGPAPTGRHVMFATSGTSSGNMGATPEQALADADFGVTLNAFESQRIPDWDFVSIVYRAVLSTNIEDIRDRLARLGFLDTNPVHNANEEVMFSRADQIFTQFPMVAVGYDEWINPLPLGTEYWTGSGNDGTAFSTCNDWTDSNGSGTSGDALGSGGAWLSAQNAGCSDSKRILGIGPSEAFLSAEGGPAVAPVAAGGLTQAMLSAARLHALDYWAARGATGESLAAAAAVELHVADLPGAGLGMWHAESGGILLDLNAAGYGWSLGGTGVSPVLNEDPQSTTAQHRQDARATQGIDLVSALTHELGHYLGFDHQAGHDLFPMADTLAEGERRVDLPGLASTIHTDKLTAENAQKWERFGDAVAVDGDVMVVGAPWDYHAGSRSGSAYVFAFDGTGWVEQAKLTAPDAAAQDMFGTSVAVHGDTIVVGSPGDDDLGDGSGSVYVFALDGEAWVQQQKLLPEHERDNQQFGQSVAIAAGLVAVGTPTDGAGTVSVFVHSVVGGSAVVGGSPDVVGGSPDRPTVTLASGEPEVGRSGDRPTTESGDRPTTEAVVGGSPDPPAWSFQSRLKSEDRSPWDAFGQSVALDGDALWIGAPWSDNGATGGGSAYQFSYDGAAWSETAKVVPNDPAYGGNFGASLAADGDRLLVGAPRTLESKVPGAAYVFARSMGTLPVVGEEHGQDASATQWSQEAKLGDASVHATFGESVAIDGDLAAVGSPAQQAKARYAGAVYPFVRQGSDWTPLARRTAGDAEASDILGSAVAIQGQTLFAGAPVEDAAGDNSGAIYLFSLADAPVANATLGASSLPALSPALRPVVHTEAAVGHTATVDYGDGSGVGPLVLNANDTFDLDHTYAQDGLYTVTVTVTDPEGGVGTDTLAVTVTNVATVVARHIFYDNSHWDGDTAGPNTSGGPSANGDDGAIATDKQALLPGQTAAFVNYTSYTRGLNGIMVDVADLTNPAGIDVADFLFRVGNDGTPGVWSAAPAPTSVSVRAAAGDGGSDRVTLIWADNAIENEWLQVTVVANPDTGLVQNDVFYAGNRVGEATGDFQVLVSDMYAVYLGLAEGTLVDSPLDFDQNGAVRISDMYAAYLQLSAPPLYALTAPAALLESTDSVFGEDPSWAIELMWLDGLYGTSSDSSDSRDKEDDPLEATAANGVSAVYYEE